MKLIMTGKPDDNSVKVSIEDDGKRTELRCVTHFSLGTAGADITLWIPEIDVEISIGKDAGEALVAIEKLRAIVRGYEDDINKIKIAAQKGGRVMGEPIADFITRMLEERRG